MNANDHALRTHLEASAARFTAEDLAALLQDEEQILHKADLVGTGQGTRSAQVLRRLAARVRASLRLLREHADRTAAGKPALLPAGLAEKIAVSLLYFQSPVDALPDAIPGLGYMDDALVLGIVWDDNAEALRGALAAVGEAAAECFA